MPLSLILVGITLVSVLPVAFVLGCSYSRNPGVRDYLSSLTRLRGVWGWALLALVFSPLLMLLTMGISSLLGRETFSFPRLHVSGLALVVVIIVKFLYQWFFFNATGEEAGWRGFVQNRLQAKFSPLIALLVMGFFWPIWHFFLWQAEGSPVSSLEWWAQQYLALINGIHHLVLQPQQGEHPGGGRGPRLGKHRFRLFAEPRSTGIQYLRWGGGCRDDPFR